MSTLNIPLSYWRLKRHLKKYLHLPTDLALSATHELPIRTAKATISLRRRRLIRAFVVHKQNNWILKNISVESKCPDDTLRNCRIMWIRAFCACSRALFRVIRLVSFRIILFTSLYFRPYIFIFLSSSFIKEVKNLFSNPGFLFATLIAKGHHWLYQTLLSWSLSLRKT